MNEQFLNDVEQGLSASPKFLLSKYFYDKKGDELFVKIMNAPEYYPTNAEFEIFSEQTQALAKATMHKNENTVLVELGAGDGTKTLELLKYLQGKYSFLYMPIDISKNALDLLEKRIFREAPEVKVAPKSGDYFKILAELNSINQPKVILFLGSTLGNMLDDRAHKFITQLGATMRDGDKLLIGLDIKKPREKVLPAYNDAQGYTRDFNLNLLQRINRELGGNFVIEHFEHSPEYDEEEGIARSFLTSKKDQEVHIDALNRSFYFAKGERIFMEMSRKYNRGILEDLLKNTQLDIIDVFTDQQKLFADFLCEKQK